MKIYYAMKTSARGFNIDGKMQYSTFPNEFTDRREYCCKAMDLFNFNIGMRLNETMEIATEYGDIELNYCPSCGKKVELIKEIEVLEDTIIEK